MEDFNTQKRFCCEGWGAVHDAAETDVGDNQRKKEEPAEKVVEENADGQPEADEDDLFLFVQGQCVGDGDVTLGHEHTSCQDRSFAGGGKQIPANKASRARASALLGERSTPYVHH